VLIRVQNLFYGAQLRGAQLIVENHQGDLVGLDAFFELLQLALAEVRAVVGRAPALRDPRNDFYPGGAGQLGQLRQGFFYIIVPCIDCGQGGAVGGKGCGVGDGVFLPIA